VHAHDRRLPLLSWLHFLLVAGLAVAGTVVALLEPHGTRDWGAFLGLAAGAAVAQLFVVRSSSDQSYHLAITFVAAAAYLLPPELVVLLCVVQHVPEWVRERYHPFIQLFNISNYAVDALATWLVFDVLRAKFGDSGLALLAAGVAGSVTFVLLNHWLLAVMLRLARGHSLRRTRLFELGTLTTDFVLSLFGVAVAQVWVSDLWAVPLIVAPLLLLRRALMIPRLEAEARRDPKTRLFNARHLEVTLAEELERAARLERPLSLIVADLDLLRDINNTYGHLGGDAVLCGVADVFHEQLRTYDVAARFGGEEFAILLPETEQEQAVLVAERVRAAVEARRFAGPDGVEIAATLSLGVASFPRHGTTADELVHNADVALYRSKAHGRNRVSVAGGGVAAVPPTTVAARAPVEPAAQAPVLAAAPVATALSPAPPPDPAEAQPQAIGERPRGLPLRPVEHRRETVPRTAPVQALVAIGVLALGASLIAAVLARPLGHAALDDPRGLVAFAILAVALQLLSVDVYGVGGEGVSAIGILACGFALGPGPGVAVAAVAAVVQAVRKRGALYRTVFDVSNFVVAAAVGGALFETLHRAMGGGTLEGLAAGVAAGLAYKAVNTGLLCAIMAIAEQTSVRRVWSERFHWARYHYVAFGALAFAAAVGYDGLGITGLAVFAIPPILVTLSVRQYLGHTRRAVEEIRLKSDELQRSHAQLAQSHERIRQVHRSTIIALSRSMEAKDNYTSGHTERVAAIASGLARTLGYDTEEVEAIEVGAVLHDIGKIGIPETILLKPGVLTREEWRVMREHPLISDRILREVDLHPFVREIARWSHERIDGYGYPDGLRGDEIPLPARIVHVADAFDAITTDRPYRARKSDREAFEEILGGRGEQFCPLVVSALEELWTKQPELLLQEAPVPRSAAA
jgi:diguanylate cyclase (GGDEF)-like protein